MNDSPRFVCVKHGWSRKIMPVNGAGWRALIAWMLAMGVIAGIFVWVMSRLQSPAMITGVTAIYVIAMGAWAIAMIRWMMARSEVIDVADLARKQQAENGRHSRR